MNVKYQVLVNYLKILIDKSGTFVESEKIKDILKALEEIDYNEELKEAIKKYEEVE